MSKPSTRSVGPQGGIRAGERTLRGWQWNRRGRLVSRPVRCRKEDWYIARARLHPGVNLPRATILVIFLCGDDVIEQRCLRLAPLSPNGRRTELVGWTQTPEEATHLQLCLPDISLASQVEDLVFHDVSERDPKCHPLANVPHWNTHRPPFVIERVCLPPHLESLAKYIHNAPVEILARPQSVRALGRAVHHAGWVLDPTWVAALDLDLAAIERLASASWMIVDLETLTRCVCEAGAATLRTVTHDDPQGLMSARIEYSDVPTRGLALQDVVPYSTVTSSGGFAVHAIRNDRAWRKYADATSFAGLVTTETPWASKHGDVLSAARPVGQGELLATDVPWLVAGKRGALAAPRIAQHLLRTHLAEPVPDHVQYWTRWDVGNVVIRDIGDLAARYRPLRPVRWKSNDANVARLGVTALPNAPIRRHTLFCTGRIDATDVHDGLPPEPMQIFMKWLAREAREQSAWARRVLDGHAVTWQFDSAAGLKYALNYESAALLGDAPTDVLRLRIGLSRTDDTASGMETLDLDEGIHGDGSFAFQDQLTQRLCQAIEANAARGG